MKQRIFAAVTAVVTLGVPGLAQASTQSRDQFLRERVVKVAGKRAPGRDIVLDGYNAKSGARKATQAEISLYFSRLASMYAAATAPPPAPKRVVYRQPVQQVQPQRVQQVQPRVQRVQPVQRVRYARPQVQRQAPVQQPQTQARSSQTGGGDPGLAGIRACESGGNYSTSTGNGYYGAYQFDHQTWKAAGGSTYNANQASAGEQDRVARNWIASGHRGAWPVCGR